MAGVLGPVAVAVILVSIMGPVGEVKTEGFGFFIGVLRVLEVGGRSLHVHNEGGITGLFTGVVRLVKDCIGYI